MTFLRLRRLYLFLFLSLFVFFLVSLTPLQSRVATFSAFFSLFRIHRVSTANLQLATSCALVCFLPRHSSLSLSVSVPPSPLSLFFLFLFCLSPRSPGTSSVYSRVEQVCRIRYHLITILEREQTLLSTTFRRHEGRDCFFLCCLCSRALP